MHRLIPTLKETHMKDFYNPYYATTGHSQAIEDGLHARELYHIQLDMSNG